MVRLSEDEAKRLGLVSSKRNKPSKRKKYNNTVCYYQGAKFDSKKELERYLILKDKEKRGEIFELKRQVKITIQPSFKTPDGKTVREIYYLADFVYLKPVYICGVFSEYKHVIEDVKGGNATKTAVYKLKKKLLAYKGFYIEEV